MQREERTRGSLVSQNIFSWSDDGQYVPKDDDSDAILCIARSSPWMFLKDYGIVVEGWLIESDGP